MARDIAALIGSRICHDLISPVGAISNGVELLSMSGEHMGPEMALISESVENANARVKFFRLAFGMASEGQMASGAEMSAILNGLASPRLTYNWSVEKDVTRDEAKLACLLILCLETALPRGGSIKVGCEDGRWEISARGDRLEPIADLWARLGRVTSAEGLKPSEIQFLLAPLQAATLDRAITYRNSDICLEFNV
ncbi:histidine phosphotransferase family protein [Celeribacter arenosi]